MYSSPLPEKEKSQKLVHDKQNSKHTPRSTNTTKQKNEKRKTFIHATIKTTPKKYVCRMIMQDTPEESSWKKSDNKHIFLPEPLLATQPRNTTKRKK